MSGFSTASPSIIRLGALFAFSRFELNKNAIPSSKRKDVGNAYHAFKKRAGGTRYRIMRYREFSRRTTDEGFLRPIKDKIAELEQKLREIDE